MGQVSIGPSWFWADLTRHHKWHGEEDLFRETSQNLTSALANGRRNEESWVLDDGEEAEEAKLRVIWITMQVSFCNVPYYESTVHWHCDCKCKACHYLKAYSLILNRGLSQNFLNLNF